MPAPIALMNPRCPRAFRAWVTNPEPPAINNPLILSCFLWANALSKIKLIITYLRDFPYSSSTMYLSARPQSSPGTRVPGDNDPGFPPFKLSNSFFTGPFNSLNTYLLTMTNMTTICTQRHNTNHSVTTALIRAVTYLNLSFISGVPPRLNGTSPFKRVTK